MAHDEDAAGVGSKFHAIRSDPRNGSSYIFRATWIRRIQSGPIFKVDPDDSLTCEPKEHVVIEVLRHSLVARYESAAVHEKENVGITSAGRTEHVENMT